MTDQSREEYWGRVKATIWRAGDYLPAERLLAAHRLVDHDEPAEGLRSVAWAIVGERVRVPADLIRAIREDSEESIAKEDMPPNLDEYILP